MRLPREIKNSLLPLLLVFAAQKVCAQLAPADDFFNGGAQAYISNNIPAAKQQVETGLKFYPGDEKLKKLEELLKQQQQSQQNQQSQSQQQKKDQQSQQQKSDDQKKSQDQQKPDTQDQAVQKKDEQQKQPQKKDGDKPDKQDAEGQPVKPGQMTPAEAKRLLDSQKGNEQLLTLQPPRKPANHNRPVNDW